jgi:hypothetical protein
MLRSLSYRQSNFVNYHSRNKKLND